MPFEIVRNDITAMAVDAIVNTANPKPIVGAGTDTMVHEKAGPGLLAARKVIGDIPRGQAAITPAFRLHARYVIHTVGPVWLGGDAGEEATLRSCYDNALQLALDHDCRSIAFPLISSGNYGFPKDKALQIAIAAFSNFLLEHEMQIYLVVFDRDAYRLSEKLFRKVASFIDENFVDRYAQTRPSPRFMEAERNIAPNCGATECIPAPCCAPSKAPRPFSLADILKQEDAGFTENLLSRIDSTGKKDSEVYKRAGLTKQHFSKIRNNPHYKPTTATAFALAIALELDLEETRDLIGRAGYALTNSSKFDLIVRYYIEQQIYNIVEINIALYEFDQPLLGA